MISLMEYLQLVNVIQYLIYEIENLKKDSKTTDNTSSDNSALEEKISTNRHFWNRITNRTATSINN